MADVDPLPAPKPRTRRRKLPVSADPLELAMVDAAAGGNSVAADAARRLLETHERLAACQTKLTKNELFRARFRTARDISVALLAVALLIGIVAALVDASRSRAIVIESFSVPPELASRGLTGEVVAQRFLDRLGAIQRRADSVRASASFADAWSGDLRVQIPSTGVSLGDISRSLRRWLGDETYVSGEVFRSGEGLGVTVRSGVHDPAHAAGDDGELDRLLQAVAEQVFGREQPYLYGQYLRSVGRYDESVAVYEALVASGSPTERAWGYNGWAVALIDYGLLNEAEARLRDGLRLNQAVPPLHFNLMTIAGERGHSETERVLIAHAYRANEEAAARNELRPEAVSVILAVLQRREAGLHGDYRAALSHAEAILALPPYSGSTDAAALRAVETLAALHQPSAAASRLRHLRFDAAALGRRSQEGFIADLLMTARIAILAERGEWQRVLNEAETLDSWYRARGTAGEVRKRIRAWPWIALARAQLGDHAAAEALARDLPGDCYPCVRMRGRIAALAGRHGAADRWFRQAVRQAPSLPFAYSEWGEARLMRGDAEGALALLTAAHERGPQWADPLKLRGDALAIRGSARGSRTDFVEALRSYAAAAERAPRWGALHVNWGIASWRTGRREEAREKWRAAAGMDLSRGDRARLERIVARAASGA